MSKKTYVGIVEKSLEDGKDRLGIIETLKEEFPDVSSSKLSSKLNAAIKYIEGKKSAKAAK